MHMHPWILIRRGVFARSFAGFHKRSSFLLDGVSSCSLRSRNSHHALLGASAFHQGGLTAGGWQYARLLLYFSMGTSIRLPHSVQEPS
jgi:hypothetical protein